MPPQPYEHVPNSCVMRIGDGTEHDLMVIATLGGAYELFKAGNPDGSENILDGHTVWTTCRAVDSSMLCAMGYAVAPGRTLAVMMTLYRGNAPQVAALLLDPAQAALQRLPLG